MSLSVTVGPSPRRLKRLLAPESQYLVALASRIAEDEPDCIVLAQYGDGKDEVMVIKRRREDEAELF